MMLHGKHGPVDGERASARRRAISWVLVALWAAVIFYMSSRTGDSLSTGFFGIVKQWSEGLLNKVFGYHEDPLSPVCHFIEYLVLGVLLCNALDSNRPLRWVVACAIAIASTYGVTDEAHQILVPGRFCDSLDWLTDTVGASLGSLLWLLGRKTRRH